MCSGNYKLAFYFRRVGRGQGSGLQWTGGETNLIRQLALTDCGWLGGKCKPAPPEILLWLMTESWRYISSYHLSKTNHFLSRRAPHFLLGDLRRGLLNFSNKLLSSSKQQPETYYVITGRGRERERAAFGKSFDTLSREWSGLDSNSEQTRPGKSQKE